MQIMFEIRDNSQVTSLQDYAQIDLDDLHDPEASSGIVLEMQDRQRYFEGRMSSASLTDAAAKVINLFAIIVQATF